MLRCATSQLGRIAVPISPLRGHWASCLQLQRTPTPHTSACQPRRGARVGWAHERIARQYPSQDAGGDITLFPGEYDALSQKFINCMMRDGKKRTAEAVFHDMLQKIKVHQLEQHRKAIGEGSEGGAVKDKSDVVVDPHQVFKMAIKNVEPVVGLLGVRKGGSVYQVPVPLSELRRRGVAIRWIIKAARSSKGKAMADRLFKEVMDAFNGEGNAMKKRLELHKTAEANRAYAHLRR